MTVAAGFVCNEGVLLATDTLYAGVNKRYGQKSWLFDHGDVVVGFAGAGMQAGLERTRYEIGARLRGGIPADTVIEAIQDALSTVLKIQRPKSGTETHGLFAIRVEGTCTLWENCGGAMLSPIGHVSQCVGFATALGQYFLDTLYQESMPMKWARIVAAHLIKHAKRYSEYCGGDTHLLEIPVNGAPRLVTDQSEIASLEQYLAAIDDAIRLVLPGRGATEATAGHRLKMLNEAIDRARSAVVIEARMDFTLKPVTLHATGTVADPTPSKPADDSGHR
jgi:hypothetical protein